MVSQRDKTVGGVCGEWRKYERRAGRTFRFCRAYPLIGRCSVGLDSYSHEECVEMFEESLRIPLLTRMRMWFDGLIAKWC